MTRDELYLTMNQIVRLATGIPATMPANDSHASPSGAYCSIEPKQSQTQRGQANVSITTDQTVVKPQVIAEVSFNFYRDGANDYAAALFQANKRPDVQTIMRQAGIGWQRAIGVRDLTGRLGDGRQEERAQISIFVMFEESTTVAYNTITTVPFEVEDENGNTLITNGEVQ